MVFLAEKGYADVRLTVRSAGGHSSNPFGGTSLATLGRAIARLAEADWGCAVTPLLRQTLEAAGAGDGAGVWLTGCAGVGAATMLLGGLRKPRT